MRRFLLAAVACTAPAQELEIPPNDGWVTDRAGILDPDQEQALELLMESYRSGTSHEIALLTVSSVPVPIERYALEVARAWKLGGAQAHNGALLVVAVEQRKLRIEVGRGLEGTLTDSVSGRILRSIVTPAFREGDPYAGLLHGIEAIHAAIGGDYGPLERAGGQPPPAGAALGGLVVLIAVLLLVAVLGGAQRRGAHRRGAGWWIWPMLTGYGLGRGSGGLGGARGGGGGFGGFRGFGGGGGFSGGGATGGW